MKMNRIMRTKAEYVGQNFKEPVGSFTVQICKVGTDDYLFGVLKENGAILFENQQHACLTNLTIDELIELKNSMNKLILEVVESAKETNNSL